MLANKFPLLFKLEKCKTCFVFERMEANQLNWVWKRSILDDSEMAELNSLNGLLSLVVLANRLDTWKCKLSKDGKFYVNDLRYLINSKVTSLIFNPTT